MTSTTKPRPKSSNFEAREVRTVAHVSPLAKMEASCETSSFAQEPVAPAPPCGEPRQAAIAKSRSRKPAAEMHGALLGAGLTLTISLASRVLSGFLRRKKKPTPKSVKAPSNFPSPSPSMTAARDVNLKAFGSPTPLDPDVTASPRLKPRVQKQPPQEDTKQRMEAEQPETKNALPPGQLKQQLQLLQEAQEENARLQSFLKEYMATSDKVKVLEQENADLKNVMSKLEVQLNDIKAKAVVSNGTELTSFKDAVKERFPAIARSVCSDIDFGIKDNGSIDGSASVIDVGTRKKMGALSQLFAWANSSSQLQPVPPKAAAPSQPSQPATPRRTRSTQDSIQSSDVVQLLNAFAGGMQL